MPIGSEDGKVSEPVLFEELMVIVNDSKLYHFLVIILERGRVQSEWFQEPPERGIEGQGPANGSRVQARLGNTLNSSHVSRYIYSHMTIT